MLKVALVYNLKKEDTEALDIPIPAGCREDKYLEWDSPDTIEEIKKALEENCKVLLIEADSQLKRNLIVYRQDIDVAFNIAEGIKGPWREAAVPILLEELGIPYTGSDPETLLLCLNKERTKQILAFYRIKSPSYKIFSEIPELTINEITPLEFPIILKPLHEGSSKGISNNSLVISLEQCQNEIAKIIKVYEQPVLVEEFIPGREFTVGILGNREDLTVLPIVEIDFSTLPKGAAPIFSYEAKWIWDIPQNPLTIFQCPAELSFSLEKEIKSIAISAYNALGCKDWCRIDLRLDKQNKPYVLELNPIPGILPDPASNSCLPKAARALGWTYSQLINMVLTITCRRYGIKYEYSSLPLMI